MAPPLPDTVRPPEYFPAINSLRALAILLVLVQHYGHYETIRPLSLGNAGVDIFFVISGFLITGNLLFYRATTSTIAGLKSFYIRRALRLMPLYYVYFCVAAYLTRDHLSNAAASSLLLYYSNFFLMAGNTLPWPFRHFWSLAVEEQFYLVWPLIIFLVPDRYLKPLMWTAIVCSIAFGMLNSYVFGIYLGTYVHIASCLQALALGGLLALLHYRKAKLVTQISARGRFLIPVAAVAFAICAAYYREHLWLYTLLRTSGACIAVVAISMIVQPARNPGRPAKRQGTGIFDNGLLRFIGRISYGIYVYHILVMKFMEPFVMRIMPNRSGELPYAIAAPLLYTATTIGLAWLSFRYLEGPFNRLKGKFTVSTRIESE